MATPKFGAAVCEDEQSKNNNNNDDGDDRVYGPTVTVK